MLYHLVTFDDGTSVRANAVTIKSGASFDILTDECDTLFVHHTKIKNIVPTLSSWKVLKKRGIKQATVV